MFKLLVATLAALYAVLWIFGAEDRRVEQVARADADVLDISVSALASVNTVEAAAAPATRTDGPKLSENEALRAALDAGKALRADRSSYTLLGARPTAVETDSTTNDVVAAVSQSPERQTWYVSGSRVNLRAGPGTGNDVVGQVVLGDAAHVLDERDGWYRIESVNGTGSGWIFGKFLNEQQPG